MQRQSLGSPVSKLGIHGRSKDDIHILSPDDLNHHDSSPSLFFADDPEDDAHKTSKSRRFSSPSSSSPSSSLKLSALSSPPPKPEKFIHLIPLLTLLCFLVLYLVSHSPSQSDLAHFNGFKRSSKLADSSEISDVSRFADIQRGDILAIRSMRNLREMADKPKSRYPRQIADKPKSRNPRKIADF